MRLYRWRSAAAWRSPQARRRSRWTWPGLVTGGPDADGVEAVVLHQTAGDDDAASGKPWSPVLTLPPGVDAVPAAGSSRGSRDAGRREFGDRRVSTRANAVSAGSGRWRGRRSAWPSTPRGRRRTPRRGAWLPAHPILDQQVWWRQRHRRQGCEVTGERMWRSSRFRVIADEASRPGRSVPIRADAYSVHDPGTPGPPTVRRTHRRVDRLERATPSSAGAPGRPPPPRAP